MNVLDAYNTSALDVARSNLGYVTILQLGIFMLLLDQKGSS